jgi:hypothetical protein
MLNSQLILVFVSAEIDPIEQGAGGDEVLTNCSKENSERFCTEHKRKFRLFKTTLEII